MRATSIKVEKMRIDFVSVAYAFFFVANVRKKAGLVLDPSWSGFSVISDTGIFAAFSACIDRLLLRSKHAVHLSWQAFSIEGWSNDSD
jgi:hypothetical protein